MPLAVINSIWIGPRLGPIHAACLRSFVRLGHRTVLHVYERPDDVPVGVELADANALLPESRMIRHSATGSPAIFADLLRYELQKKELGLYVDCDCYCIRPMEDTEYIYGWESANLISNAILKLPSGSPALDSLLAIKDSRALIPYWFSKRHQSYYRIRARLGWPVRLQDMPWGTTGPFALTWYLKEHGLDIHAATIDTFYPLHFGQIPLLLDPDLTIEDITTPRTRLLHLSHEKLKGTDVAQVPPTSPLGFILGS